MLDPDTLRQVRHGAFLVDVALDPRSGILYAAWTGREDDTTVISHRVSADGGRTWAAWAVGINQFNINRTPVAGLNGQAFTPTLSVAATGTVGVTYYDFHTNDAAPGTRTDYWLVRCEPVRPDDCKIVQNWAREDRVTEQSFDMQRAPWAYGLFLGDYQGLATAGEDFLALFAQPHGDDPASVFFRRLSR